MNDKANEKLWHLNCIRCAGNVILKRRSHKKKELRRTLFTLSVTFKEAALATMGSALNFKLERKKRCSTKYSPTIYPSGLQTPGK